MTTPPTPPSALTTLDIEKWLIRYENAVVNRWQYGEKSQTFSKQHEYDAKVKAIANELKDHRHILAQQAQEVERLNTENASLAAGSCEAPYGDDYGNKRCKTIDDLTKQLAAMTAERDEVIQRRRETVAVCEQLQTELAASQARVRELEQEKANAEPDTRLFITVTDHERQLATLQATLAEREARVKELEAAHFTELKERLRYTGEYRDAKRKVEQLVTDLDAARLATSEREVRNRMWTLHYSRMRHVPYGDDGRLDCNSCGRDYVAAPMNELVQWEMLDASKLVTASEQDAARLREALQMLYDEQNDAPLENRRQQWQAAMTLASDALRETGV